MPVEYLDRLMAYEEGTLAPQAVIALFQELVDSGDAWRLQGHYGRAAQRLIELGIIRSKGRCKMSYCPSKDDSPIHTQTPQTGIEALAQAIEAKQAMVDEWESSTSAQAYTGQERDTGMVVRGSQLVAKEYAETMEAYPTEPVRTLTKADLEELADLGRRLQLSLSCDLNDTGVPCYTDRMSAVDLMRRYLEVHHE